MTNAPFALDRREFIALAGGLAAVLVVGDGAYFSSRRSAAHAQPVPSESGTLTQPETPLNGTIASPNTETAAAATTSPETESAAATNTEMPPTTLEDLPWNLRLVNRDHPLAADFAPSNLAELPDASWVEPHVNHRVDARIVEDLTAMLTAAEAAGTHPIICSSFRTYDYQENLFENRIERAEREEHLEGTEAEEAAAFWVAPPGASEHQAGLAVDIVDADYLELDEGQESTAPQQWLMAHCTEYGFILRYPTDKSATTGIGYEPWHYRYVGKEAASDIAESVARRNVPRPGLKPLRSFSATAPFRSRPLRNLPSPKPRNKNAEPSHKKGGPKAAFCKEWVSQELTASRAEQS